MLYLLTSNYGGDAAVVMRDVAAVVVRCKEGGDDARCGRGGGGLRRRR